MAASVRHPRRLAREEINTDRNPLEVIPIRIEPVACSGGNAQRQLLAYARPRMDGRAAQEGPVKCSRARHLRRRPGTAPERCRSGASRVTRPAPRTCRGQPVMGAEPPLSEVGNCAQDTHRESILQLNLELPATLEQEQQVPRLAAVREAACAQPWSTVTVADIDHDPRIHPERTGLMKRPSWMASRALGRSAPQLG